MLRDFLAQYKKEILALTAKKTLELSGVRPTSEQLMRGLPIFFDQLLGVLKRAQAVTPSMASAATDANEAAMGKAAGRSDEVDVARSAGHHGVELLRLGYTLSHVVHAYGAMCQAITELAADKNFEIKTKEFHDLNQCLDVAIAGAVTEFQSVRNSQDISREVEQLGFLAHELRNALSSAKISFDLIKRGTAGVGGATGEVVTKSLKRLGDLIDRSMTEVRLRVDPVLYAEPVHLLQLVEQVVVTAEVEASSRNQILMIHVDPTLEFEADQQLIYSAVSNLIQNALKFTHAGGRIQVRGSDAGENILFEVEDECGGLPDSAENLFKPYVHKHGNRQGLGLGLTIAQRAVALIRGKIEVTNMPGKGCIFRITLPKKMIGHEKVDSEPAA